MGIFHGRQVVKYIKKIPYICNPDNGVHLEWNLHRKNVRQMQGWRPSRISRKRLKKKIKELLTELFISFPANVEVLQENTQAKNNNCSVWLCHSFCLWSSFKITLLLWTKPQGSYINSKFNKWFWKPVTSCSEDVLKFYVLWSCLPTNPIFHNSQDQFWFSRDFPHMNFKILKVNDNSGFHNLYKLCLPP